MTRRIQIQNFKGGVGKTTTSVNLAHGLALKGHRVLLIDLDHQGNATTGLGVAVENGLPTLYHVLKEDLPFQNAILETRENLWLLPSNATTAVAENHLNSLPARELQLREKLAASDGFDYIILDCPASLNILHNNALLYADELLLPIGPEKWAYDGARQILESAARLAKYYNHQPRILGALPTMLDRRLAITGEMMDLLHFSFGDKVLPAIRSDATLKNAQKNSKTIFEFAPNSKGAVDYKNLVSVIENKSGD
jgi:chromosome partitioning protein